MCPKHSPGVCNWQPNRSPKTGVGDSEANDLCLSQLSGTVPVMPCAPSTHQVFGVGNHESIPSHVPAMPCAPSTDQVFGLLLSENIQQFIYANIVGPFV